MMETVIGAAVEYGVAVVVLVAWALHAEKRAAKHLDNYVKLHQEMMKHQESRFRVVAKIEQALRNLADKIEKK